MAILFYGRSVFCDRLLYFMIIWYIFPVLVYCAAKNLATLMPRGEDEEKSGGKPVGRCAALWQKRKPPSDEKIGSEYKP
jgi:hypothetical protein